MVEAKQRVQLHKQTHHIFSSSLSHTTLLPHHFHCHPVDTHPEPPIQKRKQCRQTPASPTASQAMEARPWTSAAAAAAPVASSAAAPTDMTPPQRPNRRKETARRPHPTPRTQYTFRQTERLPRAHSRPRAVRTRLMSTSTSYSEPSQPLSNPCADQALQQPRAHGA